MKNPSHVCRGFLAALLLILLAPFVSADDTSIPVVEAGEVYPLKVHKGYPAVFLSSYEGAERGYNNQIREAIFDDERNIWRWPDFFALLTVEIDGVTYSSNEAYREVQIRQQINGTWSEWQNIEPEANLDREQASGMVYRNPSIFHTMETYPVWIEGDAAQVRHRINDVRWADMVGWTSDDWQYSDRITDWKTFNVEVISDGAEGWMDPYDRGAVSRAYFRDYTPAEYTPVGWERPDYSRLPSMNWETSEWHFPDPDPAFPHLENHPSDEFREATFQQLNFYRSLAGVPPAYRSAPEFEAEAQHSAVAQHVMRTSGGHFMFNPNSEHWPMDNPWRQYFPNNGMDIWWVQTKALLFTTSNSDTASEIWDARDIPADIIRGMIDDLGANNHSAGHRQALLNPTAFEYAIGHTSREELSPHDAPHWDERSVYARSDAIYYPANFNRDRWRALPESIEMQRDNGIYFPAPGYVPYQVMPNRFSGQTVHLDGESPAGRVGGADVFRTLYSVATNTLIHEEITARVWWNGIEMDAYMGHANYWGGDRHILQNFVVTVRDVKNPVEGEPTLESLLQEEDSFFHGPWGWNSLSGRTWYPRPRNGTDVWEVEIYLSPTAEQQETYNLPEHTLLHSYSFEAYIPHVAFEDDTYMQGDSVFSQTMGWYNAANAPWLWLEDQKTWVYTLSTDEEVSSWFWDLELGWCYAGPQGWIWSRDLGTWLYHWPNPDLDKRSLFRADNGQWLHSQ